MPDGSIPASAGNKSTLPEVLSAIEHALTHAEYADAFEHVAVAKELAGKSPHRPDQYMREIEALLARHAATLHESVAILELTSQADLDEVDDRERVMRAVDAVLKALRPIPDEIGCRVAMSHALERMATAVRSAVNALPD